MGIVLLGPPGSGKGTQGRLLAERLGVRHLSTGVLLRDEASSGTDLGRKIAPYLDRGELAPDDLTMAVVEPAVAAARAEGGYVLDGFPRTLDQASHLPEDDIAVHLDLPDDVARVRLAERDEGRSDDDDPTVIDHRLRVYHERTAPLLELYGSRGRLITVDADQPPEAVAGAIAAALEARS